MSHDSFKLLHSRTPEVEAGAEDASVLYEVSEQISSSAGVPLSSACDAEVVLLVASAPAEHLHGGGAPWSKGEKSYCWQVANCERFQSLF